VRASNVTGKFVVLPPQHTTTHLRRPHSSPSNNMSRNDNNPVDQWISHFGHLIGLFNLTEEATDALAMIVDTATTEDVNGANALMSQWINDHVIDIERRPLATNCFQERLTLYSRLTDEERDQVRTRLLRPSAVTHTAQQDEDTMCSLTSGSPLVRGVAKITGGENESAEAVHLSMVEEEQVAAEGESEGEDEALVAEARGEVLSTAATTGARTVATVAVTHDDAHHDVTVAITDDYQNMDPSSSVGEELSDLLEGVDLAPLEEEREESSSKAASSTKWSTNAFA